MDNDDERVLTLEAQLQGESRARVPRLVGRVDLHASLEIRALAWLVEQSQ